MSYLLSFDIPRNFSTLRVRVFRELRRNGAKKVHHSLWKHENLNFLISLASLIKQKGGQAIILEEKMIF
ncbi:MAG: hypothetical protein B6U78_00190 [Candidatus Aenigmarchaeota archaeon ex4484_224]|nr:MAG: hypothetical protein B6U78_00190 [Candidatus Aenigmarchaeota archaeon ex4484_224]